MDADYDKALNIGVTPQEYWVEWHKKHAAPIISDEDIDRWLAEQEKKKKLEEEMEEDFYDCNDYPQNT